MIKLFGLDQKSQIKMNNCLDFLFVNVKYWKRTMTWLKMTIIQHYLTLFNSYKDIPFVIKMNGLTWVDPIQCPISETNTTQKNPHTIRELVKSDRHILKCFKSEISEFEKLPETEWSIVSFETFPNGDSKQQIENEHKICGEHLAPGTWQVAKIVRKPAILYCPIVLFLC